MERTAIYDLYGLAADLCGLDPNLGASSPVGEPVVIGESPGVSRAVQGWWVLAIGGLATDRT
jgi:hypothetical protein